MDADIVVRRKKKESKAQAGRCRSFSEKRSKSMNQGRGLDRLRWRRFRKGLDFAVQTMRQ
jgi:hypothetical protein